MSQPTSKGLSNSARVGKHTCPVRRCPLDTARAIVCSVCYEYPRPLRSLFVASKQVSQAHSHAVLQGHIVDRGRGKSEGNGHRGGQGLRFWQGCRAWRSDVSEGRALERAHALAHLCADTCVGCGKHVQVCVSTCPNGACMQHKQANTGCAVRVQCTPCASELPGHTKLRQGRQGAAEKKGRHQPHHGKEVQRRLGATSPITLRSRRDGGGGYIFTSQLKQDRQRGAGRKGCHQPHQAKQSQRWRWQSQFLHGRPHQVELTEVCQCQEFILHKPQPRPGRHGHGSTHC
eukprot:1159873-Pelagomonas_calceolata.AAC.4